MKTPRTTCHRGRVFRFRLSAFRFSTGAFTLVEMLVVMLLLSLIVFGLMAMFGQTQRAFRAGLSQTDVLEGGRAVTDMISRELTGVVPSYGSQVTNFYAAIPGVTPIKQKLPGANSMDRTNTLENLFFLTRENQKWIAYGYCFTNPAAGAGTLFRYYAETNISHDPQPLWADFVRNITVVTNFQNLHRVLDGVIQFRIRVYDTNGTWIVTDLTNTPASNFGHIKTDIEKSTLVPGEIGLYIFKSNAVPAYVEFELGILEKRAYERFRALPSVQARNYLTNQAGAVHLFRQRVPIRLVDNSAYQ